MAKHEKDATPLLIDGLTTSKGEKGVLRSEIDWARSEARDFVVTSCGCETNPLAWIAIGLVALGVSLGKQFHRIFGQAGPVRSDETAVEKAIRIQMIYLNDGFFGLAIVGSLIDLLFESTAALDLLIDVTYVGTNILLLHALRRRDKCAVRVGIAANIAFAAGLATLFVASIIYGELHHWARSQLLTKHLNFIVRGLATLFFLDDSNTLATLWTASAAFDDDSQTLSPRRQRLKWILHGTALVFAAAFVFGVIILVATIAGQKFIWRNII